MLHRRAGIVVTYVVFDVLEVAGLSTMLQPYRERRETLETLELDAPAVVADVFDDGQALFKVMGDRGMEGVVAKRLTGRHVPGDRGSWVKAKNPVYWRLHQERELVRRPRQRITH
jgi:ATP-dependent DNA ligase